jgi:hypothetical protein
MTYERNRQLTLSEQIVRDPVLRLEFEFLTIPGSSDPYRIIVRDFAGNELRELRFSPDGLKSGGSAKPHTPTTQPQLRRVK